MKNIFHTSVTILLCAVIALSSLSAILSNFLSTTILSQDFYLGIVATPTYLAKVKDAISLEFKAQSSYTGIPEDVLVSTLDDAALHLMLRSHIASATDYLNGLAPFVKPVYPKELLTGPLLAWLDKEANAQGAAPTQEQKDQMTAVAGDSAVIIQKQICLMDLDLIKGNAAFGSVHQMLMGVKAALLPSILLMLASCVLLVLLNRKAWRVWLNGILVSFWVAGTMLLVPMLVLKFTGLTKRFAIDTPYLKYFVDSVLTDMNLYFLLWGILLFTVTSASLATLKWTYHPDRKGSGHLLPPSKNINI